MIIMKPYFDAGAAGDGGGAGAADTGADSPEVVELQSLIEKDETSLTEQEKTRLTELKGKYDIQEVDDKGNLITPEVKRQLTEIKQKVDSILAKEETARTADEKRYLEEHTEAVAPDAKDVYAQVDEIVGKAVEVDYKDLKPDSPEGIALRETVIREDAIVEYEENLKQKAPRAFEFLAHMLSGGKEEEFFAPENEDFSKITVKKEDLTGQERLYRKALTLKGNSPDEVDALVQTAKDSNKLYDKAKNELEALQDGQKERNSQNERRLQQQEKIRTENLDKMADVVEEKLSKGFGGITVPIADKRKFEDFLGESLHYDGKGGFLFVKKVDVNKIDDLLKTEYFGFKGGNLKEIGDNLAKKKNALKVKNAMTIRIIPKGSPSGPAKIVPVSQL